MFVDSYKHYNSGAHFLWIGDRTRQIDGAHIEYFSGIANPVGLKVRTRRSGKKETNTIVKVGPSMDPDELPELVRRLNPKGEAGKVTLITRCGANKVDEMLPKFIEAIEVCFPFSIPILFSYFLLYSLLLYRKLIYHQLYGHVTQCTETHKQLLQG